MSEALEGSGRRIDYTDAIAEPSAWATPTQLGTVAEMAGFSGEDRMAFLKDPDGFLQAPVGEDSDVAWIEFPHISHELDRAWVGYVKAEQERAIRTAAVRRTFEDSRIAAA